MVKKTAYSLKLIAHQMTSPIDGMADVHVRCSINTDLSTSFISTTNNASNRPKLTTIPRIEHPGASPKHAW